MRLILVNSFYCAVVVAVATLVVVLIEKCLPTCPGTFSRKIESIRRNATKTSNENKFREDKKGRSISQFNYVNLFGK